MQLDSVRSLKEELFEPLAPTGGLRAQGVPAVSLPAERTTEVATAQPGIALGIAAAPASDDYRLAVRIQHRDLIGSSKLSAIEKAARGEIDVSYIGRLSKQAMDPTPYRQRPLQIGGSIGHYAITAGTLGAFVRVDIDDRPRLLSNNHVLADENRGLVGDQILQPGQIDGGQPDADRVAVLERFVEFQSNAINEVDCALALIDDGVELLGEIDGLGIPSGVASAEEVGEVAKAGRTTGYTRGTITAIEVDRVVVDFSTGALRFDNQIEISGLDEQPFSKGGDSGSLILEPSTMRAVGLLFAGSDQGGPQGIGVTYANPLSAVFDNLNIARLWVA
jgi:hypothetical protein